MTTGLILAGLSLVTAVGTIASHYPKMRSNHATLRPRRLQSAMVLTLLLAATAFFFQPGIIGYVLGALAIVPAGLFLLGTTTSGLPSLQPAVSVGALAPDFTAIDADGVPFRLSDLRGAPVLLKFFRGYWCPYCVAELKQLNDSGEQFAALGIKLIALSSDRVDELLPFKQKHNWNITLLSDPELVVHRQYRVEFRKFTPRRGPFRDLAIPTTILIDRDGRVLSLEQTSDFRVRPQALTVLANAKALLATGERQLDLAAPDIMRGKVVLITGANSGVGFVTARELANLGARVLMVCRNPERGARAQAEVARVATGQAPELLLADMSSQASVRALAQDVHRRTVAIDVLINNAGGIFAHRELTAEGVERTFATNHLGAFLLTNLILDLVCARPGARVVAVASEVYGSKLDFDNLQAEKSFNFLGAYFRSKLENIIFTFDLARRLEGTGVSVNCISPGPTRTGFGDNMTGAAGLFPRLTKLLFQSPEKAAIALVRLASSPDVAGMTGQLFLRGKAIKTKPVTRDLDVAARLWRISAQLVGAPAEPQIALVTAPFDPPARCAA